MDKTAFLSLPQRGWETLDVLLSQAVQLKIKKSNSNETIDATDGSKPALGAISRYTSMKKSPTG